MGYAPYTRITTPPSPGNAGTVFTVSEDTGDRFPETPFLALTWPDQTLPTIGVDSEELTVLTIENDVMTCKRGDVPITIKTGAQLAVLSTQTVYFLDDPVTLSAVFDPASTGPGTAVLVAPTGELLTFSSEVVTDGPGVYHFTFNARNGGQWSGKWIDADGQQTNVEDFFVRF